MHKWKFSWGQRRVLSARLQVLESYGGVFSRAAAVMASEAPYTKAVLAAKWREDRREAGGGHWRERLLRKSGKERWLWKHL